MRIGWKPSYRAYILCLTPFIGKSHIVQVHHDNIESCEVKQIFVCKSLRPKHLVCCVNLEKFEDLQT